VKIMGIPWDDVHEEAHAMEHSISPRLEAKMLEMIGDVKTCPHGHPIGDYPREPGEPLTVVPGGSTLVVLRLENEAEEVLHYMAQQGVEPGRTYTLVEHRGEAGEAETELLRDDGQTVLVADDVGRTVSVRVEERGDGAISQLSAGGAELQLLGESRWGM
jgi:DtxR family Mn-dependent transcriptional regulator